MSIKGVFRLAYSTLKDIIGHSDYGIAVQKNRRKRHRQIDSDDDNSDSSSKSLAQKQIHRNLFNVLFESKAFAIYFGIKGYCSSHQEERKYFPSIRVCSSWSDDRNRNRNRNRSRSGCGCGYSIMFTLVQDQYDYKYETRVESQGISYPKEEVPFDDILSIS